MNPQSAAAAAAVVDSQYTPCPNRLLPRDSTRSRWKEARHRSHLEISAGDDTMNDGGEKLANAREDGGDTCMERDRRRRC